MKDYIIIKQKNIKINKKRRKKMDYKEYIKPELLIKASSVQDKYIPLLLGLCAILLSSMYVISTSGINGLSIFTAITQGVLAAGASVYANQIGKQINK